MQVRCPTCQTQVPWVPAERWRPFCSERCKLIDLGAWASEKHAIPGETVSEADAETDTTPDTQDH